MLEREVTIVNPLGLHARAAMKLVKAATESSSQIVIENRERNKKANARSILDLLTLGGSQGVTVNIIIDGNNEATMNTIVELFENGFGEL